jgi:uncharacterized protein YndB with AHSA1/START domain
MGEPLRRTIEVRCSLERAFAVFTGELDVWWPAGHRRNPGSRLFIEPRAGGRFVERTAAGDEIVLGEVVAWEPPRRLVYTWYPGADDRPTTVEVRFTAAAGVTRVEVIHAEGDSGLGDRWPERVGRFERAWSVVLPAFAALADADREGDDDEAV